METNYAVFGARRPSRRCNPVAVGSAAAAAAVFMGLVAFSGSNNDLAAPTMRIVSTASQPRVASRSVRCNSQVLAQPHVTTKSKEIFDEAKQLMPGGVSSPVRAFKSVGGEPVVFDRVKGAYAWDVDGNKYVDYVGTWGPAILGHADDEVLGKIKDTMEKGTSFGAPGVLENVLAKMVIDAVPSVEMVRFTNSGTEACMGMIRLIRAYTQREKVIKFEGCYHGHADSFLVQAGSGVATLGLPDSPGVPKASTQGTLCAQYNSLESVKKVGPDTRSPLIFKQNLNLSLATPLSPRALKKTISTHSLSPREVSFRELSLIFVPWSDLRGQQGRDCRCHP
mmetsp:Transcript_1918/g.3719  ORF Transcript_1918/g.3719 Transcript_1918/m.3719 type:complete len:337 (-) Transcript_1918:922-1932(-)